MRILITIAINLLLISATVSAQQTIKIKGFLKDSLSNKNIDRGLVIATTKNENNISKKLNLLTDSTGSFSISIPKDNTVDLVATAMGYISKNVSIRVEKDTTILIILVSSVTQLAEIQVTDKPKGQLKLIPGGFNISTDTKAFTPSTFVSSYLKYVPGVTLSPKGSISFLGKELKVYVDGMLVNLSGQELINYLQQLTVSELNSIDILTEPGVSFDANSGSIINFKTKKFLAVGLQNIVGVGLTTHDKAYINNSIRYSRGSFRIIGNILANHSNFYDNNFYSLSSSSNPNINSEQVLNLPETPQDNLAFSLTSDYRINKSLQTGFSISTNSVSSKYGYEYTVSNNSGTKIIPTEFDSKSKRVKVNGYFQIDSKRGQFQIDFSHINQNGTNNVMNNIGSTSSDKSFNVMNITDNKNYFVNLRQTLKFKDNFSLTGGAKYTNNHLSNEFSIPSDGVIAPSKTDYKENIYAAFVESSLTVKKFAMQIGFRAEHTVIDVLQQKTSHLTNNVSYTNFFPNVVVVIPEFSGIKTHLFFNSGISRPTYSQYLPFPEDFNLSSINYKVGNANLQASTFHGFGIRFNKNFKDGYSLTSSLKKTKAIDPIISLPFLINNSIFNAPVNLNDVDIYGFDLIFSKQWKLSSLTISPRFEKRYLKTSNVSYENADLEVRLNGANYFAIHANYNFEAVSKVNVAVNLSYGTRQNNALGYQRGSGFSSISLNRGFLKNKMSVSLELSDPFNWSRNYSVQNFNGLEFINRNKPETRMLYFTASYTIGKLKRSKASRFSFEDDSRLSEINK